MSYFAAHKEALAADHAAWAETFAAWKSANPQLASQLDDAVSGNTPDLITAIPEFAEDYKGATRAAGGEVIQAVAEAVPQLVTGSADLFGSTKNYIKSHLPVGYILTHDSVGVGEDGPTHQPVETVSGLRVIPNLDVIRPGDPEETAGAFAAMVERKDGPTALFLTRQGIDTLNEIPVATRREGVLRGAYIAKKETGDLTTILIATGSELQHAMKAGDVVGNGVRVVSMPCMERFDRQSDEYKESVLPSSCTKRVAIEAGVSGLWYKYIGNEGAVVGIDRFGISAPGGTVMSELGMTPENLVEVVKGLG